MAYDPDTGQRHGPWRLAVGVKGAANWIMPLPGGTYGVGAGLIAGNAASSWGPQLHTGLVLPSPSTPTGPSAPDLPTQATWVHHPMSQKAPRTSDVTPHGNAGEPVGEWNGKDHLTSAVYVDLPDKHGVVFIGALSTGHIWYGDGADCGHGIADPCSPFQGYHSEGNRAEMWFYDPAVLADRRGRESWEVLPTEWKPLNDYGAATSCNGQSTGAYFDPTTRRLYLTQGSIDNTGSFYKIPAVHVFEVQ